jgi:hypothetical protein
VLGATAESNFEVVVLEGDVALFDLLDATRIEPGWSVQDEELSFDLEGQVPSL